jgi:hypothetical protein
MVSTSQSLIKVETLISYIQISTALQALLLLQGVTSSTFKYPDESSYKQYSIITRI